VDDGSFASSTAYDALNARSPSPRRTAAFIAHFNEANLLDKVEVNLRGAATATPFVTNIDYNAKASAYSFITSMAPRPSTNTMTRHSV